MTPKTRKTRMTADSRKSSLLDAGVKLAAKTSFMTLDLVKVAELAGSSRPRILQLFPGSAAFRDAVLKHAIDTQALPVVAQGVVTKHRLCRRLSEETKRAALATLAP